MKMIQEVYLNRAVRIRKDYLKITSDIKKYEDIANGFIHTITDSISELKSLSDKLGRDKNLDPELAELELKKIVMKTESEINDIDKSISELNKKMDKLREDENSLYNEIKRTYSDLDDEKIKVFIQNHFKKLNLT